MSVRFGVDDSEAMAEFDRLLHMGFATTAHERVLARQYALGQMVTHVITGSLRGSEDIDSEYRRGVWKGRISWGGPSPGNVNNPVDYAVYEAARGGNHDFRAPLERMAGEHGAVMRAHLRGRAGR